jgi:hypothetical protein
LFIANFLAAGLGISIASLTIPLTMNCKFDRPSDQVTITKKYCLYGERQTILPLSTIQEAQISKSFLRLNKRDTYDLKLLQSDGKKTSLAVPGQNSELYQEIIAVTNHFLHPSVS